MFFDFSDPLEGEIRELSRSLGNPRAIVLETERSLESVLRFLALLDGGHTVFPVPSWKFRDPIWREELLGESGLNFSFWELASARPDEKGEPSSRAAFIVRTSGSSGKAKLVLHDPEKFRKKYQAVGPHFEKTYLFSPPDSIAGIETILETRLHRKGLVIGGDKISPASVVKSLEDFSVDYFQTTPSFLNLMMIAAKFKGPPPAALKKIAFGSEPAQERVLTHIREHWPAVELIQTYGMTEIGIQRTLPATDPTKFIPDTAFNRIRISNGILEVKSLTPLEKYLNASAPFTEDGWFITGDQGQEDDGAFSVSGRTGDLINVAGRKFFPSELEDLFLRIPEVFDVTVKLIPEELTGSALVAEIVTDGKTEEAALRHILKKFLETSVPTHMHPRKISIRPPQETERFKKMRR